MGVWSWDTPQGGSGDLIHHLLPQPHPGQPDSLKRKGRENQGPLSGVMGSRLKAAQKAGGSSPSQLRTPPTHAGSNQKDWLALSWLSLPVPGTGEYGREPCSRGEEVISYNDSKAGPPEPGAARNPRKENSLLREDRCTQEIGHPTPVGAQGSSQHC